MNSKNGIDWDKQPLGEKSDKQLAEDLETTVVAVKCARKRRKIPAYRPAPQPASKPKAARSKRKMRGQAMCPACGRSDLRMTDDGRYAVHRAEAGGPRCDGSGAEPIVGLAVNGDVKLNHVW